MTSSVEELRANARRLVARSIVLRQAAEGAQQRAFDRALIAQAAWTYGEAPRTHAADARKRQDDR